MISVSFLITHFNRPYSLEKCINSIRNYKYSFNYEIIVSDDCSTHENLEIIHSLAYDKIILSKVNTGLSANINRGLHCCKGSLIIYIQEDFKINDNFFKYIDKAIALLMKCKVDMVRLKSNIEFPEYKLIDHYFELIPRFAFKNFLVDHYRYSDHPFVVKKVFFSKYGFYKEGVNTIHGENEYMVRMMKLNPKIAIIDKKCINDIRMEGSVREELLNFNSNKIKNRRWIKPFKRVFNSFRFKVEYIFYDVKSRKLLTIKNYRKL